MKKIFISIIASIILTYISSIVAGFFTYQFADTPGKSGWPLYFYSSECGLLEGSCENRILIGGLAADLLFWFFISLFTISIPKILKKLLKK